MAAGVRGLLGLPQPQCSSVTSGPLAHLSVLRDGGPCPDALPTQGPLGPACEQAGRPLPFPVPPTEGQIPTFPLPGTGQTPEDTADIIPGHGTTSHTHCLSSKFMDVPKSTLIEHLPRARDADTGQPGSWPPGLSRGSGTLLQATLCVRGTRDSDRVWGASPVFAPESASGLAKCGCWSFLLRDVQDQR